MYIMYLIIHTPESLSSTKTEEKNITPKKRVPPLVTTVVIQIAFNEDEH